VKLSTPITELKGVGDEVAKKLAILGVQNIYDLITSYPRKYQDYSEVITVKDLKPGQVTLEAQINQVSGRYVRRGLHITEAIATDATGSVRLVWFNQPYRAGAIKKNQPYYVAGEYALRRSRFSITNPSVELVSDFPVNTARIIPIYRETKGLKSFTIRRLVRQALTDAGVLPEHLPHWLIKEQKLMSFGEAVLEMHFPSSSKQLEKAKKRLGFEEVFELTLAALMALKQGFQAAFMTPTEILARQHADTLYKLLSNVSYEGHVGLLIGGLKTRQKTEVRRRIAAGEIGLMVGTHALIAEQVDMHKLGLVIVDEQHRFGVEQRKKIQAKAGHMPHVLHMTATPIPRSLALTLYGELDVSILDELPAGRQPIITKIWSPNSRKQLNGTVDKELEAGRQAFIVCPLIADSETSGGLSVEEVFERASKKDFKHRRVGLLHGRMKSDEKDSVMQKFINREYDILVSATVIEVGVDVTNASVMIIEGAERFGLAQIHQLRGRVGRGEHQSYCYMIPSDSQDPGPRLKSLETMSDGFKLAELDLQMRGPGAIYGTMQHGALDLRVANLADIKLIVAARNAAQKFIDSNESLKQYPHLAGRVAILRAVTNLN
jgi:RecG-like helicase